VFLSQLSALVPRQLQQQLRLPCNGDGWLRSAGCLPTSPGAPSFHRVLAHMPCVCCSVWPQLLPPPAAAGWWWGASLYEPHGRGLIGWKGAAPGRPLGVLASYAARGVLQGKAHRLHAAAATSSGCGWCGGMGGLATWSCHVATGPRVYLPPVSPALIELTGRGRLGGLGGRHAGAAEWLFVPVAPCDHFGV
jgi:hypothetical protein